MPGNVLAIFLMLLYTVAGAAFLEFAIFGFGRRSAEDVVRTGCYTGFNITVSFVASILIGWYWPAICLVVLLARVGVGAVNYIMSREANESQAQAGATHASRAAGALPAEEPPELSPDSKLYQFVKSGRLDEARAFAEEMLGVARWAGSSAIAEKYERWLMALSGGFEPLVNEPPGAEEE